MKKINVSTWKEIGLKEIFDIHPTKSYKYTNKDLLNIDGVNPVIGNSAYNNGIIGYSNLDNTEDGNIITFSDTTSSEAIFYKKNGFIGYPHIQGMYPREKYNNWNEYSYLFLLAIIKKAVASLGVDYVNKFTRDMANNIIIRIPTKEDKEYLKLVEFLEIQKKGYVEGFLTHEKENILVNKFGYSFFNGLIKGELKEEETRVSHIKYGVKDFAPIFSPSQAKTFLPSKDLIKPVLQEDENENEWFNMIAKNIVKYHDNKNSMVICGSFYEVEKITEILKVLLPNNNIISAKRNTPALQIIEEFKKNGGIAVVTRNYGTGVNLPKKQLEKLFITKLPFPIFTTKKWIDIKMQDKKLNTSFYHSLYQNEMFTVFRQWIGRLIRTEEDKGDLYILDSRYWEVKNHKTLEYWISKMSIIQKERIENISEEYIKVNTLEINMIQSINNYKDEGYTEEIKQYLLDNIEYVTKNNKSTIIKRK